MTLLSDLKIAVLAHHGIEQTALATLRERLEQHSVQVEIVSPKEEIKTITGMNWDNRIKADRLLSHSSPEVYDALLIPDGILAADYLRMHEDALSFCRHFIGAGKPVIALGYAIQLLADIGSCARKKSIV
jgi:protease I